MTTIGQAAVDAGDCLCGGKCEFVADVDVTPVVKADR